jgi:type II secretory pathway pseudopilin PulG
MHRWDSVSRSLTAMSGPAIVREPSAGRSAISLRPAMTLIEMVIVVIVIAAGLFLLVGWMDGIRRNAKRDLAVRMLADLDRALARYHRSTGFYPAGAGRDSADRAIAELLSCDRSRAVLDGLPTVLWLGPGRSNLADPWGTALRYFSAESDSPVVKANSGRPVFESAGPDGTFGAQDAAALADDLRSDDPGPETLRLQSALRDAMTEDKEQTHAQEDDRSD